MRTYRITADTYADLERNVMRLDGETLGYGDDLAELFSGAVESVIQFPEGFPLAFDVPNRSKLIRELYIKRFEYRLIYAVLPDEVVFLGLIHARRTPGSWKARLRGLPKR